MDQGYTTVLKEDKIIICDDVVIPSESHIYASGTLDPETKLIELHQSKPTPFSGNVTSYEERHARLGHVGEEKQNKYWKLLKLTYKVRFLL